MTDPGEARPGPAKWSIQEVVAHLADDELVGGYRFGTCSPRWSMEPLEAQRVGPHCSDEALDGPGKTLGFHEPDEGGNHG